MAVKAFQTELGDALATLERGGSLESTRRARLDVAATAAVERGAPGGPLQR